MIYEYAVDPRLITTEEKALFLLESFGLDKGRLVSELKSKQWQKLARDTIREFCGGPVARKRLMEALAILLKQKAFYVRQQQVAGGSGWLSAAQSAHSVWPYHGILLESYDGVEEHCLMKDIHLSQNSRWAIPSSITVDRNCESMLAAMKPLLTNAREVMLVDRNFRLTTNGRSIDRFKNVLLNIVDFLVNKPCGPSVRKLTYHIGDQYYAKGNLSSELSNYVSNRLPDGFSLAFTIWPKGELHDRYLLTDIGSLDCGIGLDEFSGAGDSMITLKRLSREDHQRLWAIFKQKQADVQI